ncbi:hypothetical protein OJAV_G00010050 [Oryzias javanicus]|uniref:Protein LTV1 homolog n=1 Tax=Oryzias javanicus TaxID=123683 RepID=A0A3S5K3J2_ORYJA|nr:hypothetical protein OJAV_G00010050 [Oryzias javanicus]
MRRTMRWSRNEHSPVATLHLPSSVFASEFEEEVGLLNKAAPISGPRLDMDPDIVAALDDDFDYENPSNILEDDFITKANGPAGGLETQGDDDDDEEWEDTDEEGDFDSEGGFSDEERTEETVETSCLWTRRRRAASPSIR